MKPHQDEPVTLRGNPWMLAALDFDDPGEDDDAEEIADGDIIETIDVGGRDGDILETIDVAGTGGEADGTYDVAFEEAEEEE